MPTLAEKLVRLIYEGYKIIDSNFEFYQTRGANEDFDEIEFLSSFDHQADLWEKRAVRVIKTLDRPSFLIKFSKPSEVKPARSIYITEASENRLAAQLSVLRDILSKTEREQINPPIKDKIVYRIIYTINREILLNGKLLHRPHPDSPGGNLFEFLFTHPNEVHELKKIEETTGKDDICLNIHQKVGDLGFSGDLRKIFFPLVSGQLIKFVNPITESYLTSNNLPRLENVK